MGTPLLEWFSKFLRHKRDHNSELHIRADELRYLLYLSELCEINHSNISLLSTDQLNYTASVGKLTDERLR